VIAAIGLIVLPAATRAGGIAVEHVVLANGIDLVLSNQPSVPIVVMTCLVDGGARVDPPGKAGLAGLAGSLLGEGTKGRTSREIALLVDSLGGSFSTGASQDWIELDAAVLARDFETGVDLIARSLREPTFPEEEVVRERGEVLGALAADEDSPHVVAARAFRRATFGDGPYGHPTDGTVDSVKAITRTDIVAFHRRELDPSRTVCAIVGDVETETMREVATRLLGSWKTDSPPAPSRSPAPPPAPHNVLIDMPISQATISLGQIGIARSNPDYFPILLMNHILGGGGFTSRLMQTIRTEGGLAYGVSSSFSSTRLPGPFQVILQTKVESAAEAIRLVRAEIQKLHDEGATEEELAAAKDYLTGSFPLRLDSTSKLAGLLAQVQYFGLGDDYVERYAERVRAVGVEDVRRAAAKYLSPQALVQVVVGPRQALSDQGLASSPSAP
jgi:zinc protease